MRAISKLEQHVAHRVALNFKPGTRTKGGALSVFIVIFLGAEKYSSYLWCAAARYH